MMKEKFKEFFATSWAIDNKLSVYVLIAIISLLGFMSYTTIPKEQFPEIVIPTILIHTVYPGTSPIDIENLVTRPLEKQVKSVSGVKKISSNSIQDFSVLVVEFNTDVDVSAAKQKIKDAVDKAKSDLPNNLPNPPNVSEIDISEIPIMFINISGDYDIDKLKGYGEIIQDKIEELKEITRVDIVGALDREIIIDVDMYKMQAASVAFSDIERMVSAENATISAGNISNYGMIRTIRIAGQFDNIETLKNVILKSGRGANVYLKDIANVTDGFKEQESFARLDNKNVITLNVIKKSGQNLLDASDKIKIILADLKLKMPSDLKVVFTGDQSKFTRNTLDDLNNTMIIGFVLVTIVLMFFMGFSNAFFVGLAVPLSMCIAYIIIPGLGFTMNMIVMFSFIFALGIVVDDAIVVIENTHRIHRFIPNIKTAAKMSAGEVFLPIFSGTLTTLAPFFPLAFWPGIVGKFMHYMPVVLIITLFASLFVAYVFNPVFAIDFMTYEDEDKKEKINLRKVLKTVLWMLGFAILFYLIKWIGLANFTVFGIILYVYHIFLGKKLIHKFQHKFWPKILVIYEKTLRAILQKRRPAYVLLGTTLLLFFTFYLVGVVKPKVVFFPDNEPNIINAFVEMPVGTDQNVTDSVTKIVEGRIQEVLGENNPNVESIITNISLGASQDPFDRSNMSNKGKVAINFVESKFRKGTSTTEYLAKISNAVKGIPGANIFVEKNKMGPPTGKPVNIEISAENFEELIDNANSLKLYIDSLQIPGIQEIKSDFLSKKPEIIIDIDRVRANREGLSTGQIGMEVRTAVFGKEISKYKEAEEEFPIMLRYSEKQRKNINTLMNLKIVYRDMNSGMLRQIPLSSVAKISYTNTYGGIKRLNQKRVITLSSELVPGFTANEVVAKVDKAVQHFNKSPEVEIKLTGEQEDQKDTMAFLVKAMIIAIGLIFFILITQFKSFSKTLIILSEVFYSIIGVLLGFMIFDMPISIMMTGLGIVALGGIVVRNGILIVEFTDELQVKGGKTRESIIQAGKTRITPVLLTAISTIIGMVPLAIGMNINFVTLFTELNPHIHFGGDSVAFWGPLSWTIIFGLTFATFITLILVPAMYQIAFGMKLSIKRRRIRKAIRMSN